MLQVISLIGSTCAFAMVSAAIVELGYLTRKSKVQFNEFFNLTDRSREGLVIVKPKIKANKSVDGPPEISFSVRFTNKILRKIFGKQNLWLTKASPNTEESQSEKNLSKGQRILQTKLFEEVRLDFNDQNELNSGQEEKK